MAVISELVQCFQEDFHVAEPCWSGGEGNQSKSQRDILVKFYHVSPSDPNYYPNHSKIARNLTYGLAKG